MGLERSHLLLAAVMWFGGYALSVIGIFEADSQERRTARLADIC